MDTDFPHLDETVVATARYLEALTELVDADVRAPSLLPGWSRGHVITHLARNADALAGVLHGARAGVPRPMYESAEQRDADIEAGAARPVEELRADASTSARRWIEAAGLVRPADLDRPGSRLPGSEPWPVRRVGAMRRIEVEVHHADLGTGYTPADWPADLVELLMKRRQRELAAAGVGLTWRVADTGAAWSTGDGPEVTGPSADLLWWLLGRSEGTGLACSEPQLPDLGKWA